ncbi:MAG: alpha/beta fold hydrolase [Vicinamibacterales bacterium]
MIDLGSGTPIVLIPGIQGRWEWVRPAVDALARRQRVLAFSLCDERTSGFACEPSQGFENYVTQVSQAMDRAGLRSAVVAGISYGGLIASEYAARYPDRVSRLVLVSALPLGWTPDARVRLYLKAPRLFSPLFVLSAPGRLRAEFAAALPGMVKRVRAKARHAMRVVRAPMSPRLMARRVRWAEQHRFADPGSVKAPALVVTGEPELDRIVPVEATRWYLDQLRSAEHVVIEHTGHLGIVTRPDAFADALERFVNADRIPA